MSEVPLPDLAAETLGGAALLANDEFFAPKENLVRATEPVWDEHRYTEAGKWMDGWETRRRREPGHDWCIVQLGVPGVIRQAVVDTRHFRGNHPAACQLEGAHLPAHSSAQDLEAAEWIELLPQTPVAGDTLNPYDLAVEVAVSHVRLSIHPDGGVARLRLHGEAVPDWGALASDGQRLDLGVVTHGGRVVDASDRFFSDPGHLLLPGASRGMYDGWETRRRRDEGHDWVQVALGARGVIDEIVVDTSWFRGNAPGSCEVVGRRDGADWETLLPPTSLQPDRLHRFTAEVLQPGTVDEVRLDIHPDGGVARFRVLGTIAPDDVAALALRRLNLLPAGAAVAELWSCCGSTVWSTAMAGRRPFPDAGTLHQVADEVWRDLTQEDWLEAFAAHPRIGQRTAARDTGARSRAWSDDEQAGVRDADLSELAEVNRDYEARFGWIFLICATGLDSRTILERARERLANDPDTEIHFAAEEQRKITALRLDKLLGRGRRKG